MYGQNEVRAIHEAPGTLEVQEVFKTIQGEGPFSGVPAIFVRLAGCNLRCYFCDTDFESSYPLNLRSVESVANKVLDLAGDATALCVITGGEPFRQGRALAALLEQLLLHRLHVQIETAGTLWDSSFDPLTTLLQHRSSAPYPRRWSIVCSPKTPKIHEAIAREAMAFKYIIHANELSPDDGLPLFSTQQEAQRQSLWRDPMMDPRRVYVQPMDLPNDRGLLRNRDKAVEIALRYGYTLSIQVHKIIGLP